jgi:hypothetical protein
LASENVLTHPFLRPGYGPKVAPDRRRQAMSRTTSTVLVVALHVLFFFFFVFAVRPFDMHTKPIVETILTLPLAGNNEPKKTPVNPQLLINQPERILSAPITVPKPPPIKPEVEPNAPGTSNAPVDVLGAVGRELACSAGSWEHLTSAERQRCGIYPWRAVKLPNGSLVMVPRSILPRLKEAPDNTFNVTSGADQIQNDLGRGITRGVQGGCPIMQNTPCMHPAEGDGIKIFGGN